MLRTKSAAASNDKLYARAYKPVNPGIEIPDAVWLSARRSGPVALVRIKG
jgi:hypothetical protein